MFPARHNTQLSQILSPSERIVCDLRTLKRGRTTVAKSRMPYPMKIGAVYLFPSFLPSKAMQPWLFMRQVTWNGGQRIISQHFILSHTHCTSVIRMVKHIYTPGALWDVFWADDASLIRSSEDWNTAIRRCIFRHPMFGATHCPT